MDHWIFRFTKNIFFNDFSPDSETVVVFAQMFRLQQN